MNITTEEITRIRFIAEADKNGAEGKAWDEAITPDFIIRLCNEFQDALAWKERSEFLAYILSGIGACFPQYTGSTCCNDCFQCWIAASVSKETPFCRGCDKSKGENHARRTDVATVPGVQRKSMGTL